MRRGLVFGKFMPLHRGHQHLIDTALSQCDDVTIVVYDSDPAGDFARCRSSCGSAGCGRLYPNVENILAVDDPREARPRPRLARARRGLRRAASVPRAVRPGVLARVELRASSHVELGAGTVVVDEARGTVPISGTVIRADLYEHRGWLDPLVYSSLIQKVVFVGTESSGKTTLARALRGAVRHALDARVRPGAVGGAGADRDVRRPLEDGSATVRSGSRRRCGTRGGSCSATRTPGRPCTGRCAPTAPPMRGCTSSSTVRCASTSGSSATTTSAGSRTARARWPKAKRPASRSSRCTTSREARDRVPRPSPGTVAEQVAKSRSGRGNACLTEGNVNTWPRRPAGSASSRASRPSSAVLRGIL